MTCRQLLTILLVFMMGGTLHAQEKGNIELGLGGGVNIAGVMDEHFTSDTRTGFNVFVSGDYYFSDRWSLKGKAIYDQKGWKSGYIIYNGNTLVSQTTYKLNYITIPVMANWHFGKKRNWYLNFGSYMGVLTHASGNDSEHENIKSALHTIDGGLALGIGVKIPLSEKCKLLVEYQAQSGFANIFKPNTDAISAKNIGVGFNAGLCFPIK